jgi:hypothetical protein
LRCRGGQVDTAGLEHFKFQQITAQLLPLPVQTVVSTMTMLYFSATRLRRISSKSPSHCTWPRQRRTSA